VKNDIVFLSTWQKSDIWKCKSHWVVKLVRDLQQINRTRTQQTQWLNVHCQNQSGRNTADQRSQCVESV